VNSHQPQGGRLLCISGQNFSIISEVSVNINGQPLDDFNEDGIIDFLSIIIPVGNNNRRIWNLLNGTSLQSIIQPIGLFDNNFRILVENVFGSQHKDLFIYEIDTNHHSNKSIRGIVWNSADLELKELFRESLPSNAAHFAFTQGTFTQANRYQLAYPTYENSETDLIFRTYDGGQLSTVHRLESSQLRENLSYPQSDFSISYLVRAPDLNADGLNEIVIQAYRHFYVINPNSGQMIYKLNSNQYPNLHMPMNGIKFFGN
jgi:hypothetical protein